MRRQWTGWGKYGHPYKPGWIDLALYVNESYLLAIQLINELELKYGAPQKITKDQPPEAPSGLSC